jgi:hypothetical protein
LGIKLNFATVTHQQTKDKSKKPLDWYATA